MDQTDFELWFSEAQNDFDVGTILIKEKKYSAASFHFVQAAEKAVKALLFLSEQHPWGHSILKLLEAYENLGKNVSIQIKKAGNMLDPHYINSRYPDALPNHSPKEYYTEKIVRELKEAAQNILDFVKEEKEAMNSNGNSKK
ncbi:MAG: HEPN domain-containing protein [Candidatus Helarchaeota archaeon]|nr:HEPN domain-containing protein [Candidatus Helarchaeota archaeon]